MPTYSVDALALKRTSLGEADRIVHLFTRERGRVRAVVKSARKGNRLTGATELFTYSRLQLATGQNLDIVTEAQVLQTFPRLREELERLAQATYLCELTDQFLGDGIANEPLFDLLVATLFLAADLANYELAVRAYELRLLFSQGYGLQLERCVRCGGELTGEALGFSPAAGGALCEGHAAQAPGAAGDVLPLRPNVLLAMRRLLSVDPATLDRFQPSRSVLDELERLLRPVLRLHTERDLRSVAFLDSLRVADLTPPPPLP